MRYKTNGSSYLSKMITHYALAVKSGRGVVKPPGISEGRWLAMVRHMVQNYLRANAPYQAGV